MVPRPDRDELRALARACGLEPAAAEEQELAAIVEATLAALDVLDDQEPELPVPVEAVRDAGARPSREADPLNALVRTCSVRAESYAGLLSGMRVAVKDAVAIAGVPLTCGSKALEGFVPTVDATVTDRILRSGGEIVAITNMDDLAFSGGGDSSWYGPTLNPWDPSRTAGGSSGGSAAALFYDGVDVSLGGDQGGSIRGPASWCGVVGLKPTHSLVPYTGIVGIDQTFDHCGPMGRTTRDVASLLQATAGLDPADPRQRLIRVADYLRAVEHAPDDLIGLRIGVVREGFGDDVGTDPATVDAVRETIGRLEDLGAETRRVSIPAHVQAGGISFAGFLEGMYDLCTSGGNGVAWPGRYWEELAVAFVDGLRDHADQLSPQMKTALVAGRYLRERFGGRYYGRAQNLRPWLRAAYEEALEGIDVLLMPTTPWCAHEVEPAGGLTVSERVLRGWACLANTHPSDMTGHPAISLPLAEAGGLPVGVMLVGRHFEDDRLLAIAATCERALGWRPAERSMGWTSG